MGSLNRGVHRRWTFQQRGPLLCSPARSASFGRPPLLRALGVLLSLWMAQGCGGSKSKGPAISGAMARKLRLRASACFERGDYACAMSSLERLARSGPRRAELLNEFAIVARFRYYQSGDMDFRDQELDALRKAAKLEPRVAHIQVNLGTTAWELGMRKEAAEAYRQALRLEPNHPDAALMRARVQRSTVEVEDEQQ